MKRYLGSTVYHEEADEQRHCPIKTQRVFQLTASRRGWRGDTVKDNTIKTEFQLTASRRGWLFAYLSITIAHIFQLTASRRGWHDQNPVVIDSTVFQLTASRRGWRWTELRWRNRFYFNSQPHEEADPSLPQKIYPVNISTHSLTKRLT